MDGVASKAANFQTLGVDSHASEGRLKDAPSSLVKQGAVAFLWGTGGGVARIVLQLGAQIALARVLGPEAFGLFALGVVVVGFAAYFADFGLAYGLIQKQDLRDDEIRFVWTWQCALGLAVALVLWTCSRQFAELFAKPEAQPVFAWLSLVCLFNAMAAPSTNLLKKALDHKTLQLGQLASYVAGYVCVGIPMALAGHGVASLVTAMVIHAAVNLLIVYARVRHSVAFRFRVAGGSRMLGYGAIVLATNLVNWILTSADRVIAGRVLPAQTFGLYTTAFNVVNSPASAAHATLQSVVFASCARLQEDPAALKKTFLRLLATVCVVAFPLFAVLAVGASVAMSALYGESFAPAEPYLRIFAFAMPCLMLWGISTPILWNSGRTRLEFQLQIPMVVVWCGTLALVASQSGTVIAFATAVLLTARAWIMAGVAARLLAVTLHEFFAALRGGALLTLGMTAAAAVLLPVIQTSGANFQVQLLLLLVACGVLYLVALVALGPLLLERGLASFVAAHVAQLPPPGASLLRLATRHGEA